MARYRKVDVRLWSDEKFRRLSKPQPCGQVLWLYLLTGRNTCIIPGMVPAGPAAMAEDLEWQTEDFGKAFRELLREGMVEADLEARLVFIPNAIRYNPPANPNVVISWRETWDEIPECQLKTKARQVFKGFLKGYSEAFLKAFEKACPERLAKGMANQEQEQEQEQDKTNTSCAAASAAPPEAKAVFSLPINTGQFYRVSQERVAEWAKLYPAVDVMQELRSMRGWLDANPKNRKTTDGVPRFINSWLRRAQNSAPRVAPAVDLPPIKLESGKPVAKIELPPNLNQERGESLWLTALRIVRKEINQHTYETWLVPTKALGTDGSDLYIRVPTEEFIHLGEKFGKELYSVLKPMGICQLKFIPKAIAS